MMKNLYKTFAILIVAGLLSPAISFAQWVQTNGPYGGVVSVFATSTFGREKNLFAGTWGGGVFLSTNNGTSWTAVNSGLTNFSIMSLAVSGTNLFAGTQNGLFLSTDNGNSWNAVDSGLGDKYVLS